MKIGELFKKYNLNINNDSFIKYLKEHGLQYEETFATYKVNDDVADDYLRQYVMDNLETAFSIEKLRSTRNSVKQQLKGTNSSREEIEEEIIKRVRHDISSQIKDKMPLGLFSREEIKQEINERTVTVFEAEAEANRKRKAMAEMLITSGFNFDGYTITKYSGYISGDDAVSVDRGLAVFGSGTNVKDALLNSLVEIRRNALRELKEAAYNLGCNAVIGVDFDYLTLDPQTANLSGGTTYQPYIFAVTANGNAVIIEKDKD